MQNIFMFPNDYGYTVNIYDEIIRNDYIKHKIENKIIPNFPTDDVDRIKFEIEISEKYREKYIEFCNSYGSVTNAIQLMLAANKISCLLLYEYARRQSKMGEKQLLPLKGKAIETKYVELVETESEYLIIAHFNNDYDEHIKKTEDFSLIKAIRHYYDKLSEYLIVKADLYNRTDINQATEKLRKSITGVSEAS